PDGRARLDAVAAHAAGRQLLRPAGAGAEAPAGVADGGAGHRSAGRSGGGAAAPRQRRDAGAGPDLGGPGDGARAAQGPRLARRDRGRPTPRRLRAGETAVGRAATRELARSRQVYSGSSSRSRFGVRLRRGGLGGSPLRSRRTPGKMMISALLASARSRGSARAFRERKSRIIAIASPGPRLPFRLGPPSHDAHMP